MRKESNDIIMHNKVFLWIALVTGFILMIPFLAMQFDWREPDRGSMTLDGVNWGLGDFIIMGTLLFGAGSTFVLAARRVSKRYRVLLGVVFALAILYIWAELAVGIFTNLGS